MVNPGLENLSCTFVLQPLPMIRFFVFVFGLFASLGSFAQFNDSVTQHAKLSVSGNINRTNLATTYLLNNEARYSMNKPRTVLNTLAAWVYGKQASLTTNNDFQVTTDFNLYNQKKNFYYWGLANYTTSLSLRINNQLQTGLGAAYNLVNTTTSWINISNGLLFETSSVAAKNQGDEAYQTIRNSFRLAYRFVIRDLVIINGTNFLQNSLSDGSDYIIRTNNSAGIKLNRWLSFTAAINYNQFRRTSTENLLFTYGLTAEKYF